MASGSVTNVTGSKTAFFCCTFGGHGYDAYLFSGISFGGLSLGSGTYWLGISHYNEPLNANFSYWASSSGFAGNQQGSDDGGTSWSSTDMEGAFSIYGTSNTVPEPTTLLLLGTGLVGLFGAARRRGANIS